MRVSQPEATSSLEVAPNLGQNRAPDAGISLPKNNLPPLVSALGWNAGLVSSRLLRGVPRPRHVDLHGAVCLEPEPHGIVNPPRRHRVHPRRSCAEAHFPAKCELVRRTEV